MSIAINKNIVLCIIIMFPVLSCSRTTCGEIDEDIFSIETATSIDGNFMAIIPKHNGEPFGPLIERDSSDDTFCSVSYCDEDFETNCFFRNNKLHKLACFVGSEFLARLSSWGPEGFLTSSSTVVSGKNITYNYDNHYELGHSGRLLSIVSETSDSTIVLLDRGDTDLHLWLMTQESYNQERQKQSIREETRPARHGNNYDICCRVDTSYYLFGGIKTAAQMVGDKRHGAFVKFNRDGIVVEVSTYFYGKEEGPHFTFNNRGYPKMAGYKSGDSWIGTLVEFHERGIPKRVTTKVDSTTVRIYEYDSDGEFLGMADKAISSHTRDIMFPEIFFKRQWQDALLSDYLHKSN